MDGKGRPRSQHFPCLARQYLKKLMKRTFSRSRPQSSANYPIWNCFWKSYTFRLTIINTKQGLRWTWKLWQCTNWKVNLRICKLAKASNKENWSVQLIPPAGVSSWSARQTRCTDQLDGPAGWTSSFYLKPWPVCIFEDWRFSLYIVTASESNEGLVLV